jgi:hypothetical protein
MTAPTSTFKRNGGPVQRAQGSVTGTYTAASDVSTTANASIAAGVLTVTLGFVPTYAKVMNVTDSISLEWYAGMNQGDYIKTIANGTVSLATDDALTITSRTGAGGSASQSGGSADTTASGVMTFTFSGISSDNDTLIWVAEG